MRPTEKKKENNLRKGAEGRQRKRGEKMARRRGGGEVSKRKTRGLRKRGMRRNDGEGRGNNNKETRRQDNARRRSGVHSCFLLVSGYSSSRVGQPPYHLVSPAQYDSSRSLVPFPISLQLTLDTYERYVHSLNRSTDPLAAYSFLWDSHLARCAYHTERNCNLTQTRG